MAKFLPLLVIVFILAGIMVVSLDKVPSGSQVQELKYDNVNRPLPSVEVYASESRKFEANEFLTVARMELHGQDKEALFKQLESRRQSIFNQMKKIEVDASAIEQSSVYMHKDWSYDKGERSFSGYVVSQSFDIKSSSRSMAAAIIAMLSAEQDVEISFTTAYLKDESAMQKEIIMAAGQKAKEKAQNYAESVGGHLGKVITVYADDGGGIRPRRAFGLLSGKASPNSLGGVDESVVEDSVEITASIRLTVELVQ